MQYTDSRSGPSTDTRLLSLTLLLCWIVPAGAQSVIDAAPYDPDSGTLSIHCGALIDGEIGRAHV